MLFNSYLFIFLFLPITFCVFFLVSRKSHTGAAAWLTFASLFFYAFWSLSSLPFLVGSFTVNYWFGLKITSSVKHRKALLIGAIVSNLLLLGYFKYVNFFIVNSNVLLSFSGIPPLGILSIALPIGISFFTFTQIAFLADSFQGKAQERNFTHYVLFVTFFPHLVAGPIIHHKQVMSQFSDPDTYRINPKKISLGLAIFILGLAKKLLLADQVGEYADLLFSSTKAGLSPNLFMSWLGSLSYSFQLYFDFSGYSDMAVGLSLLFGIVLPINFNAPMKATSIISFWQRWHMSLTKYINEYLYTPLALEGARLGYGKPAWLEMLYSLIIPTIASFLLIGLWHGASWTYVVFGGMHGALLVINHVWRKRTYFVLDKKLPPSVFAQVLGWGLTFFSVNATFVMFRADSIATASNIYKGMLGINGLSGYNIWNFPLGFGQSTLHLFILLFSAFCVVLLLPSTATLTPTSKKDVNNTMILNRKWAPALLGLLFLLGVIHLSKPSPFLYFHF